MSEGDSTSLLLQQVADLQRQLAEANAEAKKRRIEKRTMMKDLEDLRAEQATWAKDRAAPEEWQQKAVELQHQLRLRDHHEAWRVAIGDQLADKVPLEDVWSKLKYEPGDTIPTADQIKEQAKAAHDAAPYLFRNGREAETTAPGGATQASSGTPRGALSVPLDVSRGDRDTGIGRMVVRNSDLRNPTFMMSHTRELAEASKKGTLTILPD